MFCHVALKQTHQAFNEHIHGNTGYLYPLDAEGCDKNVGIWQRLDENGL